MVLKAFNDKIDIQHHANDNFCVCFFLVLEINFGLIEI